MPMAIGRAGGNVETALRRHKSLGENRPWIEARPKIARCGRSSARWCRNAGSSLASRLRAEVGDADAASVVRKQSLKSELGHQ